MENISKEAIVKRGEAVLMNTYKRDEKVLVSGKQAWVTADDGKDYLDFVSGIATNVLGHADEGLVEAITQQAKQLIHTSNLYWTLPGIELAEALVEVSGLAKVFFANSGTEANEGAIKLARKWGFEAKGESAIEIITMQQSFHGRTIASLTATGQKEMHHGFGPVVPGFNYVPFNDAQALKHALTSNTCAILLEVIQGEGGINLMSDAFIETVNQIQKEANVLILIDEIQTGMGRTGSMFAFQQTSLQPDIITLAKGLGGGVPIGAVLATEATAKHFGLSAHGSTFGGNPLATAAGLYIVKAIKELDLLANVQQQSRYLVEKLTSLQQSFPVIKEIRGKGLLIGIELDVPVTEVIRLAYEQGLLVTSSKHNVLRILPPLNVTKREMDYFLTIFKSVLEKLSEKARQF